MARSGLGSLLTAQHRAAQIQLRALTLRDYLTVWPLWDGTEATWDRLVAATLPLVRAHHQLSSSLASTYYEALRRADSPGGSPTPRLASLDEKAVVGTLGVTGMAMTRRALMAGQAPQAARQTALVRTSGTVTRMVLNGGRETLVRSVDADRRGAGYDRVLSPGSCDFCQSRAGETVTGDFEAHDHCSCTAEPVFL